MGAAGRPKGTKNKDFHKAEGDRKSTFKAQKQEKQKKANDYFKAKTAANRKA
jgi:hypothetical protein